MEDTKSWKHLGFEHSEIRHERNTLIKLYFELELNYIKEKQQIIIREKNTVGIQVKMSKQIAEQLETEDQVKLPGGSKDRHKAHEN